MDLGAAGVSGFLLSPGCRHLEPRRRLQSVISPPRFRVRRNQLCCWRLPQGEAPKEAYSVQLRTLCRWASQTSWGPRRPRAQQGHAFSSLPLPLRSVGWSRAELSEQKQRLPSPGPRAARALPLPQGFGEAGVQRPGSVSNISGCFLCEVSVAAPRTPNRPSGGNPTSWAPAADGSPEVKPLAFSQSQRHPRSSGRQLGP